MATDGRGSGCGSSGVDGSGGSGGDGGGSEGRGGGRPWRGGRKWCKKVEALFVPDYASALHSADDAEFVQTVGAKGRKPQQRRLARIHTPSLKMFSVRTVAAALLPTPMRVNVPYRTIAMGEWMAPGGSSGAFLREEFLIKNFLCQRAIQTQLYIHTQMKNEFHKDWLMQFVEEMGGAHLCTGSRQLHSHTALFVPWNEFLIAVMDAPDETQVIEVTGSNRRIGGAPTPRPPRALCVYTVYRIAARTTASTVLQAAPRTTPTCPSPSPERTPPRSRRLPWASTSCGSASSLLTSGSRTSGCCPSATPSCAATALK